MASTNKTTHYELSKYVGTDKPTYLTDYNNDMSAIDTGIYNAQTKADSAFANAGTADGKADTAITNAGLAQGDASTALTRIGTMANLETTEKTNLVGAINEVKATADEINKFNLSATTYNYGDLSITGGTITSGSLTVAKNSDGSICKVYGNIIISKTSQTALITIPSTGIIPTAEFVVYPNGTEYNTANYSQENTSLTFKTNGDIVVTSYGSPSGSTVRTTAIPFVIFVKDFGDVQ